MVKNVLLFLDDEREPKDCTWIDYRKYIELGYEFVIVRTFGQFEFFINNNPIPSVISFDHDIQDFVDNEEKTGYDCMKFFCDFYEKSKETLDFYPEMIYHTQNPIGKKNMQAYSENYKKFKEKDC